MKAITIYGPPGTGKTRTLVESAAEHAKNSRDRICFLTYTRSAAQEAKSRISNLAGTKMEIAASTIHSLAFSVLGLNRSQVVDAKKLLDFGRRIGVPFKSFETDDEPMEGDEYMAAVSLSANKSITTELSYVLAGSPGSVARFRMFVKAYGEWKRTYGYIDFDDMLFRFAALNKELMPRYECVMLDEAQDCSNLQWRAFENFISNGVKIVTIAGDDDQSIFEWNGANPHGMDEFSQKYNAQVFTLDKSFRVPRLALDLAKSVIDKVDKRQGKEFDDCGKTGTIVEYGDVLDVDYHEAYEKSAMVIVRDRFRSLEVQRVLNSWQIPYSIIGGVSPFENRWAKAVRLYERFIHTGMYGDSQYDHLDHDEIRQLADLVEPRFKQEIMEGNVTNCMAGVKWYEAFIKVPPPNMIDFYCAMNWSAPLKIRLTTVHQAKGREADNTIVDLTMSGRALEQLDMNPDSERRVWYVALTRTADNMYLCGSNPIVVRDV